MSRKKTITIAAIVLTAIVLLAGLYSSYSGAIFQEGNPVPYLSAAVKISKKTPFVKVDVDVPNTDVYITRNEDCPELFQFVEDCWNVTYADQFGSIFLFENELGNISISSRIYWKFFRVWSVPQEMHYK